MTAKLDQLRALLINGSRKPGSTTQPYIRHRLPEPNRILVSSKHCRVKPTAL